MTTAEQAKRNVEDKFKKGRPKRTSDDYPKIHETMLRSLEWQRWYKHNMKEHLWDVDETQECGWMSKGHWDDFVHFIKTDGSGLLKGNKK